MISSFNLFNKSLKALPSLW